MKSNINNEENENLELSIINNEEDIQSGKNVDQQDNLNEKKKNEIN